MATKLEITHITLSLPKETLPPTMRLEPLRYSEDTLNLWVKWMNDPDIRQYMYADLPKDKDMIQTWLEIASSEPNRHYFTIISEEKNIGFVSIRRDENPQTTGEIGIIIGEKAYQGKGIGNQALKEVLTKADKELKFDSLRALIKPFNEKSIALFTKNGFVKDAYVHVNGEPFHRFIKTFAIDKI